MSPDQPSYRVKKIQVQRGDAIDQIKFTYDDGKVWSAGHDSGKADNRVAIMTNGEFLVRVTHEKFHNYMSAGAAVEFETNKGRVFSYNPVTLSTRKKSEQTTIIADQGKEIISLNIIQGVLVGVEQRFVPLTENIKHEKEWYTLSLTFPKEDCGNAKDGNIVYNHFHLKQEAIAEWKKATKVINQKQGRAAVLFDSINMKPIRKMGKEESVEACISRAISDGYANYPKEESVSMIQAVVMLMKVLRQKNDIRNFILVVLLLSTSFYLDLNAKMLSGHVLTTGIISDKENMEHNWITSGICEHVLKCDGSISDSRKALILGWVIVKVLESLFYVLNVFIHHNACDAKNHELKTNSFNHVLSLDQSFFDTKTVSEIRSSMNAHSLNNLITWNIPYIVTLSLKLVMILYFLFSINMRLAAITLGFLVLIKVGILDPMSWYETNVHKIQRKLDTMNNQIVSEAFDMISPIKLFSKENHHISQHNDSQQRYMKNINTVVTLRCIREFSYDTMKVISFCTVMYQSLQLLDNSTISAASLAGFFFLYEEVIHLFNRVKWHCDLLIREFGDIERFLSLMEQTSTIVSGTERPEVIGKLEFQNVVFEYPSRPSEKVLKGLNLNLAPQKITAIVGDSGAGKSTITKLLMRLYDPTSGSVCLDGHDIRSFDLKYLHDQVAIVSQNPELYNCSLRDNIAYGATGPITDEQVHEAAKLAKCYDFITSFRSGFDTFAGARGAQLSGGQKQRIAIARAAIRNPKILILDEATAALDAENEELVQQALENIMQGKTIIVIAHRLSTIKNADEIICMKGGEVVERGTHDSLMILGGVYSNLISLQLVKTAAPSA
mmetsp:Transcript_32437/g.40708  ORF Transcript_32437/g.40708 Transcript_32437/m.40708 type:complete len:837 (+) Transcript_32437:163-2673(+)